MRTECQYARWLICLLMLIAAGCAVTDQKTVDGPDGYVTCATQIDVVRQQNDDSSRNDTLDDSDPFSDTVDATAVQVQSPSIESSSTARWDSFAGNHALLIGEERSWFGGLSSGQRFEWAETNEGSRSIFRKILLDHRAFYDVGTMTQLGAGIGVAAVLANPNIEDSSIDASIHRHFHASVNGASTDEYFEFLHGNKDLGDGLYSLPVFSVAWGLGAMFPENQFAKTGATWGERSLRAFLVGGPPMLLVQRALGASRPGEAEYGSEWRFFADDNGVSGHSFMSALPFLTAARMSDDNRVKSIFYAASVLGSLSRINDGAHYTSQAALGWWFAYLAAAAVDDSDLALGNWNLYATHGTDGPVAGIIYRY